MPYNLVNSDGSSLVTLADQTIDNTTTSISLIGKGAPPGYGIAITENFLYLLENFASVNAPGNPQTGQQWFNTTLKQMQQYDGAQWVSTGGFAYGSTSGAAPLGLTLGGLVSHSNRKAGSTGTVLVHANSKTTVALEISEGEIVSAACNELIQPQYLPSQVLVDGVYYDFLSRFVNGLSPGINMTTSLGYEFCGIASSVQADVAERYEASQPLEPGDVVELGGANEIQKTRGVNSDPFGVVSTAPGVRLNSKAGEDASHPYVALVGRVPCKVIGTVNKFDYLVCSATPGVAMAAPDQSQKPSLGIGRALQEKTEVAVSVIEIAVK